MNFTCQDRYLGLYLFRVAGIAVREPQNVVAKPPQSVASVRVETLLILRIVVATIYLNDTAQFRQVQIGEIKPPARRYGLLPYDFIPPAAKCAICCFLRV